MGGGEHFRPTALSPGRSSAVDCDRCAPQGRKDVTMPEFSSVHHVNFSVTDLERSAAWYQEVLGLDRGWEMEDEEGRGKKVVLLHPSSPLRIVLSRHQSNAGDPASE